MTTIDSFDGKELVKEGLAIDGDFRNFSCQINHGFTRFNKQIVQFNKRIEQNRVSEKKKQFTSFLSLENRILEGTTVKNIKDGLFFISDHKVSEVNKLVYGDGDIL